MGRHAGQAGESGPHAIEASSLGGGTAVLTDHDPRGVIGADARATGGIGLSSAFGFSAARRTPGNLPAIGSPEHDILLSGGLDLSGMLAAQEQGPLVGFAPIVLDPAGPSAADLPPAKTSTATGAGRRGQRPGTASGRAGANRSAGRPGGSGRSSLPAQRPSAAHGSGRGRVRPAPPVVAGLPTGALGVDELLADLALPTAADDPALTGELARPFVTETSLADWVTLEDVPPPISVDVFQKAVRAGVAPEEAAAALAATPGADLDEIVARVADEPGDTPADRRRRTRREQRSRERALGSLKGVTARRLAKGGVLAITALGVVSSANPQTLGVLGLDRDGLTAASGALGFENALAPKTNVPPLSARMLDQQLRLQQQEALGPELADQVADQVAQAGMMVGGAGRAQAFAHDAEIEARHQAELARATAEANRNPRRMGKILAAEHGWTGGEFRCLDLLWTRESQWNYRAYNPSGAYGIPQAKPGNKMSSVGKDWQTNAITQMKWGLNYIGERYGTPCGAWAHSEQYGWY